MYTCFMFKINKKIKKYFFSTLENFLPFHHSENTFEKMVKNILVKNEQPV